MVAFLASLLAGGLAAWLFIVLELRPWRRAAGASWPEQARRLFTARLATIQNTWLIPAAAALGARLDGRVSWIPCFLGALVGTTFASYAFDRQVRPGLRWGAWLHLLGVQVVFRFLRWAALAIAVACIPVDFDWRSIVVPLAYVLFFLGFEFGLHVWLLRILGLLRPPSPRLATLVEEVRAAQGVPVRATWELAIPQANALAFIGRRDLAFTTELVAAAPDDELRAITLHELAHLAEPRWIYAARVAAGLWTLPLLFFRAVQAHHETAGVVVLGLVTFALYLLRPRLILALEHKADRAAITHSPDPAIYAWALERLHRLNLLPVVIARRLRTHPDLYDRMVAAGVTPEYPRPEPPQTYAWSATILTVLCTLMVMVAVQG